MTDGRAERVTAALERIAQWMSGHGASLLVENLAPAATSERLAQAEAELGFALPADLHALWSTHDGQREEMNGFVEALDLLSSRQALSEQETVLLFVEFLRAAPNDWKEAGITKEEVQSNHWLPFAARDSDSLVVSGVTGRVFSCGKDSPPLHLLAASLWEWLEQYAARVVADDYAVEEGFGDYYLQRRDREAEQLQIERDRAEAEHRHFRRETPLLDQMRKALAEGDGDRCGEVLEDALDRNDTQTFDDAVGLLFASNLDPRLVASTLRPLLNQVVLAPNHWVDVAIGGALLDNHAIRDIAISRCAGVSVSRVERLAATAARATASERELLEDVLRRVRAQTPTAAPRQAEVPRRGHWLSRLFGGRAPKR